MRGGGRGRQINILLMRKLTGKVEDREGEVIKKGVHSPISNVHAPIMYYHYVLVVKRGRRVVKKR